MRITEVKTHLCFAGRCNLLFIEIETSQGITGVGEASLEGKSASVAAVVKEYTRYLVGKDPFQIENHWQTLYRGGFWRGGVIQCSAISGIDQALWDIKGKKLGVPVYELFGGRVREKIRVYTHTTDGEEAERLVKMGYDALKTGSAGPHEDGGVWSREDFDAAVKRIANIREKVGEKVDIMVDNHGRFTPAEAISIGKRLEPYRIFFFEEPVPPEDVDALKKVSSSLNMPIATGERLYTRFGFKEVLEKHAVDVIQPDLCHAGGISEVRRIAAMAEAYFIKVAPHNPLGPVSTAACIQLDACTPNFLIQELALYERFGAEWVNDFVKEPFKVEGGYIKVPDKPGIGVELNLEVVEAHPYRPVDLPKIYMEDGAITEW